MDPWAPVNDLLCASQISICLGQMSLELKAPIYSETAAYGHMGRTPGTKEANGKIFNTFTWERLDMVDAVKAAFGV